MKTEEEVTQGNGKKVFQAPLNNLKWFVQPTPVFCFVFYLMFVVVKVWLKE